jgi:hypothetical protein
MRTLRIHGIKLANVRAKNKDNPVWHHCLETIPINGRVHLRQKPLHLIHK